MAHLTDALLNDDEIAHFRVAGFVIKRGKVDPALMAQCRERFWDNVSQEETAANVGEGHTSYGVKDAWARSGPFRRLMESITDVAEQLLGEDSLAHLTPGFVLPNFPSGADEWRPPTGGHLDGCDSNNLMAVTLFDTVKPEGGGFTVWPGTHLMNHRRFQLENVHEAGLVPPWPLGRGVEFSGEAGDVCYCHPWTFHTAGHNVNDRVRLCVLSSWCKTSRDDDYNNIGPDLWWYWDGMKKIEEKMRGEGRAWAIPVAV